MLNGSGGLRNRGRGTRHGSYSDDATPLVTMPHWVARYRATTHHALAVGFNAHVP